MYYTVGDLGGSDGDDGDDSSGIYTRFKVSDVLSRILSHLMKQFSKKGTNEMLKCVSFAYICSNAGIDSFKKFLHTSLILLETERRTRPFLELHFRVPL